MVTNGDFLFYLFLFSGHLWFLERLYLKDIIQKKIPRRWYWHFFLYLCELRYKPLEACALLEKNHG